MNKLIASFILLVITVSVFAQTQFQKAFYIDNNGHKIEGFIKNKDWLNAPKQIEFKTSENSSSVSLDLEEVSYFEVGILRYKRFNIQYDITYTESIAQRTKEIQYEERRVFLQQLVEGEATLYKLGDQNRFYFTIENDSIQHLVFKEYREDAKIRKNESYKSQLFEAFKCDDININDIQNLDFKQKELMKLFVKYNNCKGNQSYVYEKKYKPQFHISPKIGLRSGIVKLRNDQNKNQNRDFDRDFTASFGIEIEYVLPFNNDKWSVFFNPVYQSYYADYETEYFVSTVDYKSIELYLGLRYYMYLSKNSTIYLNASLMNSDFLLSETKVAGYEVGGSHNFTFGGGYLFKDRWSIGVRVSTNRQLLIGHSVSSAHYQYYDVSLGYRIF